jgi:hypothetical protein
VSTRPRSARRTLRACPTPGGTAQTEPTWPREPSVPPHRATPAGSDGWCSVPVGGQTVYDLTT